jgi:alanyl-tRNA synthetase
MHRARQVMIDVSYRVIADHLRCLTFALTDGAMPSNEGRGYVLRRILRRAVRYGRQYLNMHEPFLCDLVPALVDHMGEAFPELHTAHGGRNVHHVSEIIRDEEAGFMRTLGRGLRLASAVFSACTEARAYSGSPTYNRASVRSAITRTFAAQTNVRAVSPRGRSDLSSAGEVFEETQQIGRLRTLVTDEVLDAILATPGTIPGEIAFTLHDTYGFPIDLTEQMALERGLSVNIGEYERLMEDARERARGVRRFSQDCRGTYTVYGPTDDSLKYTSLESEDVLFGWPTEEQLDNVRKLDARAGERAVVLGKTCFYAEQGGQVGDRGVLTTETGEFDVANTLKQERYVLHIGTVRRGEIQRGQRVRCKVAPSRISTMRNHTATHLLNWALREVLCAAEERENPHVQQKGSLVDPDKTRFDFSHSKPLTDDEISRIDALVNERIRADLPVYAANREEYFVDQKLARRINTLRAVFGEKYPDKVRVVSIGAPITEEDARAAGESDWLLKSPKDPRWMDYSVEFCGGTHVRRTGEIQDFVLVAEESVAKGIRRVVGITGEKAGNARRAGDALLAEVNALVEPPRGLKPAAQGDLPARLAAFQQRFADAEIPVLVRSRIRAKLEALQQVAKEHAKHDAAQAGEAVRRRVKEFLAEGHVVSGIAVVVGEVPEAPVDALRGAVDWVRGKTGSSAVFLGMRSEGKVTLLAGMSRDAVERGLKAGDLIREVAPLVGGKGGGRPDMAQGGGTDPTALPAALERARQWLVERL